jgi:hypothetical protein
LLNIKRLAYEVTPVSSARPPASAPEALALPKAPATPAPAPGIGAGPLAKRIDQFLASRGYVAPATSPSSPVKGENAAPPAASPSDAKPAAAPSPVQPVSKPLDFVCEDDVRQAFRQGRKLVIGERTIVTPSARDFGDEHRVFVAAEWPR